MKPINDIVIAREIAAGCKVKASHLADWMLAHGVGAATTDEIAVLIGTSTNLVRQRLAPLRKRGEIVPVYRGLWVAVAPEYRSWGAPPAIEIVGPLMRYLDMDYYIGWLSAAALLGASHHAPQVFQVATSYEIRDRVIGRSKIQFYKRKNIDLLPTIPVSTKAGEVPVSSRAVTLLDIASDPAVAAGLNNTATLVSELAETDERYIDEIIRLSHLYSAAAVRRLGWFLENFAETDSLSLLADTARKMNDEPSVLASSKSHIGPIDKNWRLIINAKVEVDI